MQWDLQPHGTAVNCSKTARSPKHNYSSIYHPTGSDFQHDEDGFRKCYCPQITLFTHHAHSSRSSSHFLGKRNSEPPCHVKPCPERRDSFQPFLYLVSKMAHSLMFWIWWNQKTQQEVIILLSKFMTLKSQSRNSSRGCCKATKISPGFCKTSSNLRVTCFSLGLSLTVADKQTLNSSATAL